MPSYLAVFRTHVWDSGIAAMADRARSCCPGADFVVAVDETNGKVHADGFDQLTHTDDFSDYGLPGIPAGRVLWWNADYVLYAARHLQPEYQYYVMIEYDVFLNCNVDDVVASCAGGNIDLAAESIRRIGPDDHWSHESVSEMAEHAWWALIPLVVVSGRAIDAMLRDRRFLAEEIAQGRKRQWPYCEAFLPTSVAGHGFSMSTLDAFVDTTQLRFRPLLSSREPSLRRPGSVSHPVMSGERYVRSTISHCPAGVYYTTDGRLCTELQGEDAADLRAVLGDSIQKQPNPDGTWSVVESVMKPASEIFRPWVDLAWEMPATQSSHSSWSNGGSAEADAAHANRDPLPADYAFHTSGDVDAWWQVDLLETCVVERVEILNRLQHLNRFSQFRIMTSLDGEEWTTCFTKLDGGIVSSDPAHPGGFTLDEQVRARYVRIVQLEPGVMHLRRVRVLGFRLSPATSDRDIFRRVLATAEGQELLAANVMTIVGQRMFGGYSDSYNVDAVAVLAACIDSSQFAAAHMEKAQRFGNASLLHDFAAANAPATGMVLEFGVFSGSSINRLAGQMPDRRVYGFDSFEGLPESWRPGFGQGTFGRRDLPSVAGNVELVIGWFDKTLPGFVASRPGENVALLHVDCDLYSSTKTVFNQLADRIVRGTIIVFDEYFNYPEWRLHEHKAFEELRRDWRIDCEYIGLVPGHQQVVVRVTNVG